MVLHVQHYKPDDENTILRIDPGISPTHPSSTCSKWFLGYIHFLLGLALTCGIGIGQVSLTFSSRIPRPLVLAHSYPTLLDIIPEK